MLCSHLAENHSAEMFAKKLHVRRWRKIIVCKNEISLMASTCTADLPSINTLPRDLLVAFTWPVANSRSWKPSSQVVIHTASSTGGLYRESASLVANSLSAWSQDTFRHSAPSQGWAFVDSLMSSLSWSTEKAPIIVQVTKLLNSE